MLVNISIANAFTDLRETSKSHWAEKQVLRWKNYGVVSGYQDGSFKPDGYATRAELTRMINNVFGYYKLSQDAFSDIHENDWFYDDALIGIQAGFMKKIQGDLFNPNGYITREEFSIILKDIFELSDDGDDEILTSFYDYEELNDEGKEAFKILLKQKIVHGYEDGYLQPKSYIARAEAITLLDNMVGTIFSESGTYKDQTFSSNVIINSPDVVLENINIDGNLYISDGVKEGEVYLNNVHVEGDILVTGGGENSIYFNDATARRCMVNKENGKVRLVATGATEISDLDIKSGVTLEEKELYLGNTGFLNATVSGNIPIESEVSFLGDFNSIEINSQIDLTVTLNQCYVEKLTIHDALEEEVNSQTTTILNVLSSSVKDLISEAHGCKITLSSASKIDNVTLKSKTTVVLNKDSEILSMDVQEGAEGTDISGEGSIDKINNDVEIIVDGENFKEGEVKDFSPPSDDSDNDNNGNDSTPSYDSGTLNPDTTDNTTGQPIEIVISLGSDYWKNNISKITIDGKPIPIACYTIDGDTIRFDSETFYTKHDDNLAYSLDETSGTLITSLLEYDYAEYDIMVHSAGYDPVKVSQRIITSDRTVSVYGVGLYYFKDYYYGIKEVSDPEELILNYDKQYYAMFKVSGGSNSYVDATAVENINVIWTSADTSVAQVSELGLVTGIGGGETSISVDFGGYNETLNMKVAKRPPNVYKDYINNIKGEAIELTFSPEDAVWLEQITGVYVENQSVEYTAIGNVITIPAEAFDMTPNCQELRYSDSSKLETVTQHVYGIYEINIESTDFVSTTTWQDIYSQSDEIDIGSIDIKYFDEDNKLTLGKKHDETLQLYTKLNLNNGIWIIPGKWMYFDYESGGTVIDHKNIKLSTEWESMNTEIASIDGEGEVSAIAPGDATIAASYSGLSDTFEIIVNSTAPALTADTDITYKSDSFSIGFTDTAWRDSVTGVSILNKNAKEQTVSEEVYSISTNEITFDVNQVINDFEVSGNTIVYLTLDNALVRVTDNLYNILVKAKYYADATVTQPIFTGMEEIVSLQNDSTDNKLGEEIEIGFVDNISDVDWEDTIVSVEVNNTTIPQSMFDIQTGKIMIDSQIFTSSGAYIIKVNAVDANGLFDLDNYYLQVTQVILKDYQLPQMVFAEGSNLFVLYEDGMDSTQSLFVESSDEMTVYKAVYESVYGSKDYDLAKYIIDDTITPDNYTVNDMNVIMLSSIEDETVGGSVYGAVYSFVYGMNNLVDIEISIDSGATIVHDEDNIPNNAKPLQDNDIITIEYKGDIIIQRRWDGNGWAKY